MVFRMSIYQNYRIRYLFAGIRSAHVKATYVADNSRLENPAFLQAKPVRLITLVDLLYGRNGWGLANGG